MSTSNKSAHPLNAGSADVLTERPKRVRRSIDMSSDTVEILDGLERKLGLDNHSQVIRKAVQVLRALVEFQERDITIFVAKPGSSRTKEYQEIKII